MLNINLRSVSEVVHQMRAARLMITLPACQNIACLPDNGRMQNFEMLAWSLPHTRPQTGSSEEEAVLGLLLRRHLPGHILPG